MAINPAPGRISPGGLVGSWRLASCEHIRADGEIERPFGPKPVGRLVYLSDGTMIVLLTDHRTVRFDGSKLILTTGPFFIEKVKYTAALVWERDAGPEAARRS